MRFHGTMRVNERGHLEIGGCDTVELAREFGTPLYVLDEALFRHNCREYYRHFVGRYGGKVLYAGKALLTLAVCRLVYEEGLGLDLVSGGEIYTAREAGFPMDRVYFHGNNKSPAEIDLALKVGVGRFVVDNFYELEVLEAAALERGRTVDVLLRVTPGIEAHTHDYIKTGQNDSKFGLAVDTGQALAGVRRCLRARALRFRGLHCHIGSQIFELEAFAHAAAVMMDFARVVYEETGTVIEELNLGGGLGIYYAEPDDPPEIGDLAEVLGPRVREEAARHGLPVPCLVVEPGRSIVGPAGTTLYTVGAVKDIPGVRRYVAVDGGMGDNPRPALYGARYEACLANRAGEAPVETVTVAGKYCESGDVLIRDARLPRVESGDLLAVFCTGAYNYTMSMNYNRVPRPAMVLVRDGRAELIVRRETYADLLRCDLLPESLR
jgi:diaminopimelate decarboxylase